MSEELLREIISTQKLQSEKIDVIRKDQFDTKTDLRAVRDSTIVFSEYVKNHTKTHGWLNKGSYAIVVTIVLGVVAGALKTFGVI